jgi:hypothetical protein
MMRLPTRSSWSSRALAIKECPGSEGGSVSESRRAEASESVQRSASADRTRNWHGRVRHLRMPESRRADHGLHGGELFRWFESSPLLLDGTTRTEHAGDGTHDASTSSVSSSGGAVYTSGYYVDGLKMIPCYWKGTVKTDLPGEGANSAYTSSIFVE